ncbi:carboxymuconolactone decarboxylase family protein [Haloechinothrix sp. YIM 98757]|uniref:Carboxymuconolactone decarboxylase family protein n=1 Tax=Haloechinothrix aidingensis TaxID=2752311 RepID=A0A838A7V0_9PSEU|nr:carboxymuconolactone decarboxylase family protein [Haloechinothrix aidingensis]MBA0125328.1 carboxymuconolactone decarboxylase family protein [Haloechinothrix aidingensis]
MTRKLVRAALRRSQAQVHHVTPVAPGAARGRVAEVYRQVERDFGMLAPPVTLHSPAPDVLAACWLMLRETLLVDGRAGRAAKETVAAAVSEGNRCPYCVDVHSATRDSLPSAAEGDALAGWARECAEQRRCPRDHPPFPRDQLAELAGVVVTFQYLNRMVTVFLADSPIPVEVPEVARGHARRLLGRFMRPAERKRIRSGAPLRLLPAADLPGELSWSAREHGVATALARACAAIGMAGQRSVPAAVRAVVETELAAWAGEPPGPSRAWVASAASSLAAEDRPAARLALLTAMAPYQVDGAVIEEFRDRNGSDRELVEVTAWASMAAARRVGAWLGPSTAREDDGSPAGHAGG